MLTFCFRFKQINIYKAEAFKGDFELKSTVSNENQVMVILIKYRT